jgi:hypothetical protein
MIESSLAVVGANLPLLRPLLHRIEYTFSRVRALIPSLGSKCSVSSTDTESSELEANVKKQEREVEENGSVQSSSSFELPPRREGALRPADLLQIPPRAQFQNPTASQAASYSSWTSDEWENI